MNKPIEKPLFIGLKAAKANLIPGLIIQSVMLSVVLAYYWNEPTRIWLNLLAEWKARLGYGFSVPMAMVAGALLPELLKIVMVQRGTVHRANFKNLGFTLVFWGFMGASCDTFYKWQTVWFGGAATVWILIQKVIVDQFLYCPFWATPLSVWAYEWKNRGYANTSGFLTLGFYRAQILPVLIANWGVWLVLVSIIYSLPSLLQIPLFGLALTFWVLIMTYMSERKN